MTKLFHFTVRNDRTGESIEFKGQGEGLEEAFKDGYKLMGEVFRPKNDGQKRDPIGCNVTTKDGKKVLRKLREWESDIGHVAIETEDIDV